MTESFTARVSVDALRTQLEGQQAAADTQGAILRHLQDRAAAGTTPQAQVDAAAGQHAALAQAADLTRSSLSSAEQALVEALDAEEKLFGDHNTDPIALLPVRLETVWWDRHSLRVRVYPDDLHVAQLDPELTSAEAAAGAGYWRAPGPDAWRLLLTQLRPNRAAWAAHAMRPGAPPPVIRSDEGARPQRTVTMPHHWRFVGLLGGEVVVDKPGRPIPDPLPLDLLRARDPGEGSNVPGSQTQPSADAQDSWIVHWFEALKAGMAVELTFPEGTDHLDELLVVGVRDEPAAMGAQRLRDLLHGHLFGGGLALIPPGTPTNNTPGARSGWSSRPSYPPPAADPGAPASPAADTLTRALGLPDPALLQNCAGATDPELDALTGLTLLTWAALGHGFADASVTHHDLSTSSLRAVDSTVGWRDIRDHLIDHVRSRGPLPMLRVGRQPYAVLPASSLTDWRPDRADAPDTVLAPWLLRLREKWREVLGGIPRIGQMTADTPVDEVMVDMLSRQAAATGLAMRRLDSPAFAVPKTAPADAPSSLSLAGLAPDGTLRWTTRSDAWTDLGTDSQPPAGLAQFVIDMTQGHDGFTAAATATADYLGAVQAFLAGQLTAQDYDAAWPVLRDDGVERARRVTFFDMPEGSGLLEAVVSVRNWAFLNQDGDPLAVAFNVNATVDQMVTDVLDTGADPRDDIAAAARSSATLARIEHALRAIAAVPLPRLAELLLEVIDVYSHRVDAWVTSLAARRLDDARRSGVGGVRIGGYGWVEDLRPPQEHDQVDLGPDVPSAIRSTQDGYIHAPSLQHATAAAVLRSGALSHPGQDSYSINLNSRRSRIARWLIGGVRQGQTLGALLGYRFERALHDAQLDTEIPHFRTHYPTPVVTEPAAGATPGLWARSTEAIAARNVVDGVALARDPAAASVAAEPGKVAPILADLTDSLDAVGDLLLAESVHHLVGGNPVRAGLAADTLGRGADVPDTFSTLITPHRARALTNRLAVVLPAAPTAPTGWPADPVSALAPGIEAWVAHLLGPASGWTIAGTAGTAAPTQVTVDTLGMSALATVLDITNADPAGVRRVLAAGQPPDTPITFSGNGWAALHGMAARIRALLTAAQPLLPGHLPAGGDRSVDITDVRTRLAAFAADPAVAGHPHAAALAAVAASPPDDPPADTIAEQLARARAALAADWLARARTALADVLGVDLPLMPRMSGPAPPARPDAAAPELDAWLLRYTRVRDGARTLHETLMLAGARAQRSETLCALQDPTEGADGWVGGVYGAATRPAATTHLVWHQPLAAAPDTLTGLLLDEWVELLPGADLLRQAAGDAAAVTAPPESELTGIAFHYDRPDAKAPHCVLVAVPPDLNRGWTPDTLVQVLRETLDLAKLRAVDTNDMPLMGDLLPAIRIANDSAAGVVLAGMETTRPNSDPAGPFRLEPDHRTRDRVDAGLAARVHDPLWLLTRQWQFGEFGAQDAGSPAWVHVNGSSAPIDAWRPAGSTDWLTYMPKAIPLDAVVEAEPVAVDERLRAEGGAHLLRMLETAGLLDAAAALTDHLLPAGVVDDSVVGLIGAVGGAVPDAQAVAAAIDAGGLDPRLDTVARPWRQWWAGVLADHSPDCFDPHRFEHVAELSTRGTVLRVPEYLADGLDWYCADVDPDTAAAAAAAPYTFADEAVPSPVRYGGIPADRFWEMEDSEVDLGATDASTLDTGRLLLVSFATVYGNDWFLAPLEVPCGSLTVLDRMLIHDVFERDHLIERAGRDDPTWSMFTMHSSDPDHPAASGLLMMPAAQPHPGEPLERVGVARDELANLVWAVQHSYTDGRGQRIDRRDNWLREAPPLVAAGELPAYGVQTIVPNYWFPLVPEMVSPEVIHFRLAELNAPGIDAQPEGRLIPTDLWLHEEEVPREGISMQRRSVLARWFDGSWHSWTRRQKSPGSGESSSGLAFDTVRPSTPWAP